ncbi:hypothetical protein WA158_006124 [Blastocystis sp. Blastoise]
MMQTIYKFGLNSLKLVYAKSISIRMMSTIQQLSETPVLKATNELENGFQEMKDARQFRSKGAYDSALQLYNRVGDIVQNFGGPHNPMSHAVNRHIFETYFEANKMDEMKKMIPTLLADGEKQDNIHEKIGNRVAMSRFFVEKNEIDQGKQLLNDCLSIDIKKEASLELFSTYILFDYINHCQDHKKELFIHNDDMLSIASTSPFPAYYNMIYYNNLASIEYERYRGISSNIEIEKEMKNKEKEEEIMSIYKKACSYRDLLLQGIDLENTIPKERIRDILLVSHIYTNFGQMLVLTGMKKEGGEMLKSALKLAEKVVDNQSTEMSRILGYMAFISFKEEQIITSEGLYRTSVDNYKSLEKQHKLKLQEYSDYISVYIFLYYIYYYVYYYVYYYIYRYYVDTGHYYRNGISVKKMVIIYLVKVLI